jgi:hypothetical protein
MITRTTDLSPVMQPLAYEARDATLAVLAAGGSSEYPWPPLARSTLDKKARGGAPQTPGVGEHGGFASGIRAVWSGKNFGWITRSPHAHLFAQGTERHSIGGQRVTVYSQGRGTVSRGRNKGTERIRHRSKAATEKMIHQVVRNGSSAEHSPARHFDYLSSKVKAEAQQRIPQFLLRGATQ